MSEVRIHRAELAEPLQAEHFLHLLDAYARDAAGGGAPLSAYTRTHLVAELKKRPAFSAWIAYDDELPVGLVSVFEGFSTFAARPLLNVHDLVVLPAARGRGVARALLGAVEAEARRRDCCKLTLEVLEHNRVAHALYRRVGFASYELDPALGGALFLEKKL